MQQTNVCPMLLLTNLGQPELINVDCYAGHLAKYLCIRMPNSSTETKQKGQNSNANFQMLNQSCGEMFALQGRCWALLWHQCDRSASVNHRLLEPVTNESDIMHLKTLLSLTSLDWLNVASCHHKTTSLLCIFSKHTFLSPVEFESELVFSNQLSRKVPYVSHRTNVERKNNLFPCTNGSMISLKWLCDGQIDCPVENSDEEQCTCDHRNESVFCHSMKTNNSWNCRPLFLRTRKDTCQPYFPKEPLSRLKPNKSNSEFERNAGQSIAKELCNDLVADCHDQNDEPELISLLTMGTMTYCADPKDIPCKPGHSKCYSLKFICLFRLDKFDNVYPCRNAGHMENCVDYQCVSSFKCVNHYCIPWFYVCDKKVDCPHADDEDFHHVCERCNACIFMQKCNVMCVMVLWIVPKEMMRFSVSWITTVQ